jgi:hypothetical protein
MENFRVTWLQIINLSNSNTLFKTSLHDKRSKQNEFKTLSVLEVFVVLQLLKIRRGSCDY